MELTGEHRLSNGTTWLEDGKYSIFCEKFLSNWQYYTISLLWRKFMQKFIESIYFLDRKIDETLIYFGIFGKLLYILRNQMYLFLNLIRMRIFSIILWKFWNVSISFWILLKTFLQFLKVSYSFEKYLLGQCLSIFIIFAILL